MFSRTLAILFRKKKKKIVKNFCMYALISFQNKISLIPKQKVHKTKYNDNLNFTLHLHMI